MGLIKLRREGVSWPVFGISRMLSVSFFRLLLFRVPQTLETDGTLNRGLRVDVFSDNSHIRHHDCLVSRSLNRLLSIVLLLCLIIVSEEGSCETGKAVRGKKTPIVSSTPTSVPASNVKLFSATFFEETCRYFDRDGWGGYVLPIVSGTVRGGGGGIRSAEKCSVCRSLAERFTRGCKRAVGVSPKKIPRALEPRVEFIRYVTEVVHNSRPPSPEEIKTFLSILAIAYQKAPPGGREYFSILDSFVSPPLLSMLSVVTPAVKHTQH
jgi:hypothetical protein